MLILALISLGPPSSVSDFRWPRTSKPSLKPQCCPAVQKVVNGHLVRSLGVQWERLRESLEMAHREQGPIPADD
jgi:hypothetical protein